MDSLAFQLTELEVKGEKDKIRTTHKSGKKMRIDAGFSIRKLASLIGVSHTAISQWEKEAEKLPYHRAVKIASVCGHTEAELDQPVGQLSQVVDYLGESQRLLQALDGKRLKAIHLVLICLNLQNQTLGEV